MVENHLVNSVDLLGLEDCDHSGHSGKKKFNLLGTDVGPITNTGKPAEDIIELGKDLLGDIQNLGRLQSGLNAGGAAAAGRIAGGWAKAVTDATPDLTVLALGESQPDLVEFVGKILDKYSKAIGNNPAKGGMITVKWKCHTCVCDEQDWYNPHEWFVGDVWGWDDPDEKMRSFQFAIDGDRLVDFDNENFALFKTVDQITLLDVANAVEIARKSCIEE